MEEDDDGCWMGPGEDPFGGDDLPWLVNLVLRSAGFTMFLAWDGQEQAQLMSGAGVSCRAARLTASG